MPFPTFSLPRSAACRLAALAVALLIPFVCWSQEAKPQPAAGDQAQGVKAELGRPDVLSQFRVGPGDILHVNVWKEPEVSGDVTVRPDGFISLPLIKDLRVDGLTPPEIKKAVTEKLKRVLADPNVTVVLKQINSKKIYVVGQVRKVGAMIMFAPMTVVQALSEAGGPNEYANTKAILVLRNQNGKQERFKFNYKDFVKGRDPAQNISLQPGDTVIVP